MPQARSTEKSRSGKHSEKPTRSSNRRLQIIRKTADLFVAHGFETTSMGDIAEANDISKPGLYYHFESKQELLAAIIDLAHDQFETGVNEIIATSTDPEERLRRLVNGHALSVTRADDAVFAILAVEELNSLLPADRTRTGRRKRAYIDLIKGILDALQAEGKLVELDTVAAAQTIIGMVLWIPKWYKPRGRLSAEQLADEITNLAMRSVLKPG